MEHEIRQYTVTIKPVAKHLKGDMYELGLAIKKLIDVTLTTSYDIEYELKGTPSLHCHMLIQCPYIKSKKVISYYLLGYHLHLSIIHKSKNMAEIKDLWYRYIKKEQSDAQRFYELYGNQLVLNDM